MNEESRNWKKTLGAIADSFGQPLVAVLISLLLGAVVIMICGENVFNRLWRDDPRPRSAMNST